MLCKTNQLIDRSINYLFLHSITHSLTQSIHSNWMDDSRRPLHFLRINCYIKCYVKSNNKSIDRSIDQLFISSFNQSLNQSINQSIDQSIDRPINWSINQLTAWPLFYFDVVHGNVTSIRTSTSSLEIDLNK